MFGVAAVNSTQGTGMGLVMMRPASSLLWIFTCEPVQRCTSCNRALLMLGQTCEAWHAVRITCTACQVSLIRQFRRCCCARCVRSMTERRLARHRCNAQHNWHRQLWVDKTFLHAPSSTWAWQCKSYLLIKCITPFSLHSSCMGANGLAANSLTNWLSGSVTRCEVHWSIDVHNMQASQEAVHTYDKTA